MTLARLVPMLFLVCAAPALAQNRRIYLRTCEGETTEQLKALENTLAVGDEQRAADLVVDLLTAAAKEREGSALVLRSPQHHQTLRGLLLRRLPTLPAGVLSKVREFQERMAQLAFRGEAPPSWSEHLRRFPAAPSGGRAATVLWERAYEQGDLPQCWALYDFLAALHPALLQGTAAQARIASMLAMAPAPPKPTASPADGARLLEVANRALTRRKEDSSTPRTHSPAFPRVIAERVCVSNGSQLGIYGLDGSEKTAIPIHGSAAAKTPPPTAGLQARIATWNTIAIAPQVLEHWLAPGRGRDSGAAAFNGSFYSLLAFDPARGRILWWDGDAGPLRGDPEANDRAAPGLREIDTGLSRALRRSHVLACVADAARIYVALTLKGEEPELALMAFERATGEDQPLVLRPAWPRLTRLLAADRTVGSGSEDATAAEMAASLALDGRGRLVCTTDLGFAACLDTRTGDVHWAREAVPEKDSGSFSRSQPRFRDPSYLPPEPAEFTTTPDGTALALFFAGDGALVAARADDGALLWRRLVSDGPVGRTWLRRRASRIQLVPAGVFAYGDVIIELLGTDGSLRWRTSLDAPIVGEGVLLGERLIAPVRTKRGVVLLRSFDVTGRGEASRLAFVISKIREPVNLAIIPGGLVAASRSRVAFMRWTQVQ